MSSREIVNVPSRVSSNPLGAGGMKGRVGDLLTPTFNNAPQPRQFQMKILSRSGGDVSLLLRNTCATRVHPRLHCLTLPSH